MDEAFGLTVDIHFDTVSVIPVGIFSNSKHAGLDSAVETMCL